MRTINRLIIKYKNEGESGFLHGNRGKRPARAFDQKTKEEIIDLYITKFGDANYKHFCEILKDDRDIIISDTTLNNWLRDEYILSPKARRKTKKTMKKIIKDKLDVTESKRVRNQLKESMAIIDSKEAHPTRPRSKFMGEMIQMDASSFQWVKDEVWHLHLAIDDASGTVVGAYFDKQETLHAYYHVFHQILSNYGIPAMFYTDRRTVFEYKRKNTAFDDDDTFTQFSYACKQLGVDIKTTSVAQAKGRIERLNQTFQSRLPVELRRAHVTNIDAANAFLNSYIKKYNKQFALHLNSTQNVYETQPDKETINTTLAILSPRVVDGGNCIRYKNKVYRTSTSKGVITYFKKGTTALVIESFDKNLYVNILDQLYLLKEVDRHELYSSNFDVEQSVTTPKEKKRSIPPMSHPWKHASYMNHLAQMKHRESCATI